jgi:hypothetical protein
MMCLKVIKFWPEPEWNIVFYFRVIYVPSQVSCLEEKEDYKVYFYFDRKKMGKKSIKLDRLNLSFILYLSFRIRIGVDSL